MSLLDENYMTIISRCPGIFCKINTKTYLENKFYYRNIILQSYKVTNQLQIFRLCECVKYPLKTVLKQTMNGHRLFSQCVIILSISVYLCLSEIRNAERRKQQNNEINNNDIIAKLNQSDPIAFAAAIEKEPKFFDEFECKYGKVFESKTLFNSKLESEKINLTQDDGF